MFGWTDFGPELGRLQERVAALEAGHARIRAEWQATQLELENTQRIILNTIRGLRKRAGAPLEPEREPVRGEGTDDITERVKRRRGGA